MTVTTPPRPPRLDDRVELDRASVEALEALIEEARRRTRRRRQRNFVGFLAAMLGALGLYSLLGGGGPQSGSASPSESSSSNAAPLRNGLPEELSFSANKGIVLVSRDGTRQELARGVVRRQPDGTWLIVRYFGIEWSPDGSKLLALRWRANSSPALVAIDADTKSRRIIASPAVDGRWSPDGRRIAFVRHERGVGGALYVTSYNGRTVTRLADHLQIFGTFSWSPDGTELAYVRQRSPGLFIARASDGATRRVGVAAGADASPTRYGTVKWSPDGSLIVFTGGEHSYVIRPDGMPLRQLTGGDGYESVWSPDSQLLAIVGPAGGRTWANVSVVRSDGTGRRIIARCRCGLRGPGFSQSVAWSSDGSRIAHVSGRGNTVSTTRPDGSGATVIATQAARGLTGDWYPGTPLWRPPRVR